MATRLIVSHLTLALCLQLSWAFYAQLSSRNIAAGETITVPTSGLYLVAMVADPEGRVDMGLVVNDDRTWFTASGQDDAVAGLTVALPLNNGDHVQAVLQGSYDVDGASLLTVVLVTERGGNFVTAIGITRTGDTLAWRYKMDAYGNWVDRGNPMETFRAGRDGMYWVSARPDSGYSGLTGVVKKKLPGHRAEVLFRVFCHSDKGVALSSSGAFYLYRDHSIFFDVEERGREVQVGSILSFVELTDNNHTAFTGLLGYRDKFYPHNNVGFGNHLTNVGDMYNGTHRWFSIPRSGLYVVSLRGDPEDSYTAALGLYRNRRLVFTAFSEEGLLSGQTTVLGLTRGDVLEVRPHRHVTIVESGTMMSIAFVSAS